MRFLFVEHYPTFGGPQGRAVRLRAPLAEHGWDTVVALPNEPGSSRTRLAEAGLELVPIPLGRMRRSPFGLIKFVAQFPLDVWRLWRVARRTQVNLVVISGLESPQGVFAAKLARIPSIWQINGTQTPMAYRRLMMPLARRLSTVLMTTGTSIEAQLPGLSKARERWISFFSPVDVDEFAPDSERRRNARAELDIDAGQLVIGTVGNLSRQKGHETFIRAASLIHRRSPNVRFLIFGESLPSQPDHEASMRKLISEVGLTQHLTIIDPGQRVADLAPAFDLFWFTSVPRSEGVPTAVMEALALGLPVVATDVGGVRDIVHSGQNGFLVPPLDPDAIAQATVPLLHSPALRKELGENGRDFAVAECSTQRSLDAHLRAFELALHGPTNGAGATED